MADPVVPLADPVAEKWRLEALAYASSRGYTISTDCMGDISMFLLSGSNRMRADSPQSTADQYIDSVKRLVQFMIDESPGEKELHESSFAAALWKLCPAFPFC